MIVPYFVAALFGIFFLNVLAMMRYLEGPPGRFCSRERVRVPVEVHHAWFVFTIVAVTALTVWTWQRNHSIPEPTSFSHNNHVFVTTYEKTDGPVPLAIIKHHWNCQNDSEYVGDGVVSLPPHPEKEASR